MKQITNTFTMDPKERKRVDRIIQNVTKSIKAAEDNGARSAVFPITYYNEFYFRVRTLCTRAGYKIVPAKTEDGRRPLFDLITW